MFIASVFSYACDLWNDSFNENWISFTFIVLEAADLMQNLSLDSAEPRTIAVPEPAKKVRI